MGTTAIRRGIDIGSAAPQSAGTHVPPQYESPTACRPVFTPPSVGGAKVMAVRA